MVCLCVRECQIVRCCEAYMWMRMRETGDPPEPYKGVNGEYCRDLAQPNVYYKQGTTPARKTAMWWYEGRWMVGPAGAIGTETCWAYCSGSGKC
jgi:hypothetical protein